MPIVGFKTLHDELVLEQNEQEVYLSIIFFFDRLHLICKLSILFVVLQHG
jgi:hypothetical protein